MTTGKLTVTHKDASRYFMLIPEAAGLILQAGAMGEGGEVFVLDMGEPVKIIDLAKNLIRLSGRELGVDAEIVFTGLRPGEKLHEELIVSAITGDRCDVVEKLDALVKGYRPDYEFHGVPVPATAGDASTGATSAATPPEPDLPSGPAFRSKSVH